ncbi:MAG TPA: HAMP domain-containing sensor histidine kinase [Kofleriaceae bacterium]|nr:HAMP domain-containing sensor histidine kinase [Kofleriaceae bacterium]
MGDPIAEVLRREAAIIARRWRDELGPESAIADQAPELLAALADSLDGDPRRVERAFGSLVERPALERLGYGIGLETLTRETGQLRVAVMRELLGLPPTRELCESLARLHEALDRGMTEAVRRYAARREEVRDLFIGILGHDLRDPLTSIRITARILAQDPLTRGHAERIDQACARMQRLVDDVLDFARGHLGGGIPAMPVAADMGALCRAAADELAAANPRRPITVELYGDLRGEFDRDRVVQALANLLSNAVHHGTGPIELVARGGPHAIVTEVTSHGPPIPRAVLARIFDPFAHAPSLTGSSAGLGLGLYIVEQIVLAHRATIDVRSAGDATTFSIRWPRSHAVQRRAS